MSKTDEERAAWEGFEDNVLGDVGLAILDEREGL